MPRFWMTLFGVVCTMSCASAQTSVSYVEIVERLTDLERLAVLPDKWERGGQWSSYDRASRYDAAKGRYIDWSSNRDGLGLLNRNDS